MAAEPNMSAQEPMRAIITAPHAEKELKERAELLHRIEFARRAIDQHKSEIDMLEHRIEFIDERLKGYALYSHMTTVPLTRGIIRLNTHDKYTYPEDGALPIFLKVYPEFVRVREVRELDKNKVKEYIIGTGDIPDGCDMKTETTVSVTMAEKLREVF